MKDQAVLRAKYSFSEELSCSDLENGDVSLRKKFDIGPDLWDSKEVSLSSLKPSLGSILLQGSPVFSISDHSRFSSNK